MTNPLEKVAIVGAGILGAQIAMLAAHSGYQVSAYDPLENAFDETYERIKRDLEAKKASAKLPCWLPIPVIK